MIRHLYFPLIVLFWVTMNVLLWRSEMSSGGGSGGTAVPVSMVWTRILTAPDDSSMEVSQQRRHLGRCRWWANIIEERKKPSDALSDEAIEGRVGRITGYTLDVDGNVLIADASPRLRFTWHADFATNQVWRRMSLRLNYRPTTVELRADAATQTVVVGRDDGQTKWEQRYTFAELARMDKWIGGLGLPLGRGWLGALAPLPGIDLTNLASLDPGLKWEARTDWFKSGNARMRAYRIQVRLLDKYQAIVHVSRVGEILRVELPGGLLLENEALAALSTRSP